MIYQIMIGCLSNCLNCQIPESCETCKSGYFRKKYDTIKNYISCVEDCGNGYYFNQDASECQSCDFRCTTCYGGSNSKCNSCNLGIENIISLSPHICDCIDGSKYLVKFIDREFISIGIADPVIKKCVSKIFFATF